MILYFTFPGSKYRDFPIETDDILNIMDVKGRAAFILKNPLNVKKVEELYTDVIMEINNIDFIDKIYVVESGRYNNFRVLYIGKNKDFADEILKRYSLYPNTEKNVYKYDEKHFMTSMYETGWDKINSLKMALDIACKRFNEEKRSPDKTYKW